ncbi:DUF2795 domain-containing protein [Thermobifida halotolerans]|uniref:DUF2795 domain-containing protein n=1 Tax=Thermobifida halotolerans TaxID=483545 RepID=A0AA97LVQ9_9ACTN|nr:DUF2795 domain-containing protein [Thermobifida halotolerans]UOE18890.1 DUF2795 domain-containing protein [Thermobifida halotolerans]
MAVLNDTEALRKILNTVEFPASRDDVLAHAENAGASREILSALRAMPPATYAEADEVMRAVPTATATPGRRRPGG